MHNMAVNPGAHPLAQRGDDFYATPPVAVKALLQVEPIPLVVWEPACGDGAIVQVIRATGRAVVATDLTDYGCADASTGIDFLMERRAPDGCPAIVTNPPFKLAEQFVAKATELCPQVYFLMRLAFLEGLRWQERGLAQHLARVWVFAPRIPPMHRHGWAGPKVTSSATAFAWFVFEHHHEGAPTLGWLDPRKFCEA